MKKVNLPNGRRVYEEEAMAWQTNAEQGIANQNPEFNNRIILGLKRTMEVLTAGDSTKTQVTISYGFGNSPKGYRTILLNEDGFLIEEPAGGVPENTLFECWLLPVKDPEGIWEGTNGEHPRNYVDSGVLIVTERQREGHSDIDSSALKVLKGQDYLGDFVNPVEEDLLRICGFIKSPEGEWQEDRIVALIEDTAKPFLRGQSFMGAGSYIHVDVEDDLRDVLIEWMEENTRYRIPDGRELPADSKLRRQGKTNLPDVDDRFLRAWGKKSGDRAIGSTQQDAMQRLTGNLPRLWTFRSRPATGVFAHDEAGSGKATNSNGGSIFEDAFNFDNSRQARTATENRPVNTLCLIFYLT